MSVSNSSVSDELSYLEATWSREGPPCQRMLTRINNKVLLFLILFCLLFLKFTHNYQRLNVSKGYKSRS